MILARKLLGAGGLVGGGATPTTWHRRWESYDYTSGTAIPVGIVFNPTGTKMFLSEGTFSLHSVDEYALSTAWDLTTASYTDAYTPSEVEDIVCNILFNSDGTKMYVGDYRSGVSTAAVYQYSLSTAYDVSTASYDSKSLDLSGELTSFQSIQWNSDGSSLFAGTSTIYQYDLTTPYDVSTGSYASTSFDMSSDEPSTESIKNWFFADSGNKIIVCTDRGSFLTYPLSTPYDITSTGTVATDNYSAIGLDNAYGILRFGIIDSTTLVIVYTSTGPPANTIIKLHLPSAWEITGALPGRPITYTNSGGHAYSPLTFSPSGVFFKPDGTKMYVLTDSEISAVVEEHTLSTPWDLTTGSWANSDLSLSSYETQAKDLFFKDDGLELFIIGPSGDSVDHFTLSAAWDVSTASHTRVQSISSDSTYPTGIWFKPDGTKMFIVSSSGGTTADKIGEYSLSTPWDISTIGSITEFDISTEETTPRALFFNDDGTIAYVAGKGNDAVFVYTLSTAWSISTASYDGTLMTGSADSLTGVQGVFIGDDGASLYITDLGTDDVLQYYMPTETV